jgi:hypothetical protein
MKTYNIILSALLTLVTLFSLQSNVSAQCSNCVSQYPFATQSINAGVSNQTISTCMYGSDYAICNVVAGSTYTWTTCGDTDFDTQITVRANDGTCTGAVYAYNDDNCGLQSTTPVWTATFTGTVRVLVSKYNCTSQSTCMTLKWSRSGGAPPAPSINCLNTSSFGSATINSTGGLVTISGCSYAGEYSTIYGAASGQSLSFTSSGAGDYITVRSGSPTGPVVGQGASPLTFTNTFNGTLYAHWNTGTACGTQSSCRTTTVQCNNCVPAINPCNTVTALSCGVASNYSLASGSGAWSPTSGPWGTPGNEQVFSFTPSTSGSYNVAVTNDNYYVDLFYATSCGANTWTYVNDISTSGETNTVSLTGGVTYYFLLDDENTAASSGTITVSSSLAAPVITGIANICSAGSLNTPYSIAPVAGATNYTWSITTGVGMVLQGAPSGTQTTTATSKNIIFSPSFQSGTLTVTANSACGSSSSVSYAVARTIEDATYSNEFTHSGSTLGASNASSLRASNDNIIKWDVTCDGTYTISMCGGASWDTYLYLLSDLPCNNPTIIALNDDNCGLQSSINNVSMTQGTYYIVVEGFGSTSAGSYTMNVSSSTTPVVLASVLNHASCNGFADGAVTASAVGGCDFTYSFNGGAFGTANTFSGLAAGTYTVSVMNSFGNVGTTTVTVDQPDPLVVTMSTTNPYNATACVGGSVNVTATVTGGPGAVNYTWSYENNAGGQSTIPSWSGSDVTPFVDANNASPSVTRPYRITVTAANNAACTAYGELLINIIPDPVFSLTGTNVTCNGASDGTACATLTGGLPLNYGINWYSNDGISSNNNPPGDGTLCVTGLLPAEWAVNTTASPSYGCSATGYITITEPEVLVASATNTDILCNGGTSVVDVTAVGGTSPYNGVGSYTETAGDYTYTVTDANGCSSDVSVSISEPTLLTVDAGGNETTFYGYGPMQCATLSANADGGTPGYSYTWNAGIGQDVTVCPQESGSYTVTATDANGCTATDDLWVCVVNVQCQQGNSGNYGVEMCQIPPGNPNNAHTICIAPSAVPAHLAIGCVLGACGELEASCSGSGEVGQLTNAAKNAGLSEVLALTAYPNPSMGMTTLSVTPADKGIYEIRMIDMTGRVVSTVYNGFISDFENLTFDVDMTELSSGVYTVNVAGDNGIVETIRIVKQ